MLVGCGDNWSPVGKYLVKKSDILVGSEDLGRL